MVKPELGTKRLCPNCGAKYYDLNRDPIICPRCGTPFEGGAEMKARAVPPAAVEEESEDIETPAEAVFVTLEEADEEAGDTGAVVVEADEEEVDADEADDTFLAEEDEEGDDVTDIIGGVDEEEP